MSRSSRVLDSVVLAALLATTAGSFHALDLKFDQYGRITLPVTAADPVFGGGDPPSGPPNIQCPC
jgi:hypothetical protein